MLRGNAPTMNFTSSLCTAVTVFLVSLVPSFCMGVERPDVYGKAIHALEVDGLATSEQILRLHLDKNPSDDRARMQLGITQFLRSIENLGRGLYEYGVKPGNTNAMFIRLPVPENKNPSEISYGSFLRLLDAFRIDLLTAERTLSKVKDIRVKTPYTLSAVFFEFNGNSDQRIPLKNLIERVQQVGLTLREDNPEFIIHFDRGDIAWLRAYCHLLAGIVDVYHSYDSAAWFDGYAANFFPRVKVENPFADESRFNSVKLRDPLRLHEFRKHMLAVFDLNAETWRHIRLERDDAYEWLPKPGQTDQLGLTLTNEQIDAWLAMTEHLHEVFSGERLIPSEMLGYIFDAPESGRGLSVLKLLDDPPTDWDLERITADGIDPKYLENQESKGALDLMVLFRAASLFNGPLGIYSAIRMN